MNHRKIGSSKATWLNALSNRQKHPQLSQKNLVELKRRKGEGIIRRVSFPRLVDKFSIPWKLLHCVDAEKMVTDSSLKDWIVKTHDVSELGESIFSS